MIEKYRMEDMKRGWFVGDFSDSAFRTSEAEVCLALHKKGEKPRAHVHKVAHEITAIIEGKVKIITQEYPIPTSREYIFEAGDIFVVPPYVSVAPEILEDTKAIVVKVPSVPGDKYFVEV
jgi:mannose-6-phosphate isomerase-like protein (cupin superfamily)